MINQNLVQNPLLENTTGNFPPKRRVLNKNPNWNHNNNNIFHQPTYGGGVWYDEKVKNKEETLKNYFFPECNKIRKSTNSSKRQNLKRKIKNGSVDGVIQMMRENGTGNFDNLLKVDVIQSFLTISRNPNAFSVWMSNSDEFIKEIFTKENTKNSHKIKSKCYVRRENSSTGTGEDYIIASEFSKVHQLSKASLINKTYFLVLLFERKITPDNFSKVLHYFQNYYPQLYDGNWSICTFLHINITEDLKKWSAPNTNSALLAQDFFSKICGEYEFKIIKRFQITKSNPNQTQAWLSSNLQYLPRRTMYTSGIQAGIHTVLGKYRQENIRKYIHINKKKKVRPTPMWRMKVPENKDKGEWKEKAYRKYLEYIWETNGLQLADTLSNIIL